MSTPNPDGVLFDTAQLFVDASVGEFAASANPVPARAAVIHGDPVYEDVCDGFLWCRWTEAFLTNDFPNPPLVPPVRPPEDRYAFAAIFDLGVVRCAPGLRRSAGPNRAKGPTAAELSEAALVFARDAQVITWAVRRVTAGFDRRQRATIGPAVPLTTEGRVAGSSMTVTVELC